MSWWRRLWEPTLPFSPARFPLFYGWVIVAVATIGIVFSIPGQTMGFSVFTDILMEQLGLTRVQLSAAYCIGTVLSGFTLPIMGTAFDRLGARRMACFAALSTGVVLIYLSQVRRLLDMLTNWFSFVPRVVLALAVIMLGFYLIRAAAQGVLTMASRNAIGKWFDYHRGTALALSGVVTAFSFSIAPRFLDELIRRFGWSGAWQVMGVATIAIMATTGWLFFRDNPEECGLQMDGGSKVTKRKVNADSVIHRDYTRKEALGTLAFWVFNLTFAFTSLNSTAFTFHIVSIGSESGLARAEVLSFFVPMSVISVVVNLLSGWSSSRTRLKIHLCLMNVAALLGVIGTIYLDGTPGRIAFIIGNGLCWGFFASLTGIVWPRFFGRNWLGAISGVGMSSMVIASGIGPLIFSLSLKWTESYAPILWALAFIPASLLVASWWADNPQRQSGPSVNA
jgi:hypothetical protein